MCRSDALIGLSSTRTSAWPGAEGGVGISSSFNTSFGSPVSRKINAFINTCASPKLNAHRSWEHIAERVPTKYIDPMKSRCLIRPLKRAATLLDQLFGQTFL